MGRQSEYFSLVIGPSMMHVHGAVWPRHCICGVFIALVALFFTQPSAAAPSAPVQATRAA